ncbi:MAG TPA: hypothetical protein PLL20_01405 [Phycisphaerae bacterium]|nr:hypothetical protein [Phycisphaerae bacterium]HRR84540.1 hypothetical protein [Phycisphaerae bacterium]
MYTILTSSLPRILRTSWFRQAVAGYGKLLSQYAATNAATDRDFQTKYASFWQMRWVRGDTDNSAWLQTYFQILEEAKGKPDVDIEAVARQLYEIPVRRGKKQLQFSFVTKLRHMRQPTAPIYDANVEAFFMLPRKDQSHPVDERLANLMMNYEFLVKEYDRVISNDLLREAVAACRTELPAMQRITDEKAVDFMIWGFVNVARKGAVRDRTIVYS